MVLTGRDGDRLYRARRTAEDRPSLERVLERVLLIARAYGTLQGEPATRIELHQMSRGRRFDHGVVVGESGRELARVGIPGQGGYDEFLAAWRRLRVADGPPSEPRTLDIDMDGRITFR